MLQLENSHCPPEVAAEVFVVQNLYIPYPNEARKGNCTAFVCYASKLFLSNLETSLYHEQLSGVGYVKTGCYRV
jgi:hypothetical protein